MIAVDHITFDGDTAWLVVSADPDQYGWAVALDRPCDTCGGKQRHRFQQNGLWCDEPCPDCIDGRHTFTVEVDTGERYITHDRSQATNRSERRRVSIVPGMVLPIVDGYAEYPDQCIVWLDPPFGGLVNSRRDGWGNYPEDNITLPPAAAPGMCAVQLKVAK